MRPVPNIRGGTLAFMIDNEWILSFREKLDEHYAWPAMYVFKFIVPVGKEEEVKKLFEHHATAERPSKQGKYVSITSSIMMPSADAVIHIYQQASAIEGLIAL